MESTGLATLIVGGVCVIGLIEFVGWIFVVIRHPGYEDLRPDFDANAKCSSPMEDPHSTYPRSIRPATLVHPRQGEMTKSAEDLCRLKTAIR